MNATPSPRRFIVTAAPGLGPILEAELKVLGLAPRLEPSGVFILEGDWDTAVRVMIHARTASRVLLSLREFAAGHRAMLYDQVRRIPWPHLFTSKQTIGVFCHGDIRDRDFVMSFAPLKIKDAICDEFRKGGVDRPFVNRKRPDVRVEAFFFNGRCELSVDLCGAPLHRRGYRADGARAPLREDRAAALLLFAGYDGSRPFVDPFCGSGTLAIEAALMASGRSPGTLRSVNDFALGHLFPDAGSTLRMEHADASKRMNPPAAKITGSDIDAKTLAVAKSNALKAEVDEWITWSRQDALTLDAPDSLIAANPPYGERIADRDEAVALLREFVHRVKHHALGSRMALILPAGPLEKAVGLKPERKLTLKVSDETSRLLVYDVYAGSRKTAGAK